MRPKRHQGRQSREEVERLKQELAGAVAKGPLKSVHDQAVAVTTEALGVLGPGVSA